MILSLIPCDSCKSWVSHTNFILYFTAIPNHLNFCQRKCWARVLQDWHLCIKRCLCYNCRRLCVDCCVCHNPYDPWSMWRWNNSLGVISWLRLLKSRVWILIMSHILLTSLMLSGDKTWSKHRSPAPSPTHIKTGWQGHEHFFCLTEGLNVLNVSWNPQGRLERWPGG